VAENQAGANAFLTPLWDACEQRTLFPLAALLLAFAVVGAAYGQTNIVSDNYDVSTSTTGFGLDHGVNYGINPLTGTTRMTGKAATGLRYIQTGTDRSTNLFGINDNQLRVRQQNTIGRFTLSANGVNPFNFASALGTAGASPINPAIYEITITMRNYATNASRFSFALATVEDNANFWDFGVQLYHAATGNNFYTVRKRIDRASYTEGGSSGTDGDINAVMTTTAAGTWAGTSSSAIDFLIRVTDAGAESGANYNSRVQVSMDNGTNWVYDTSTDSALTNRFRFDGAGRYITFDQANNTSGNVFYDNFSVVSIYAPPPPPERVWTGGGTDDYWSTGDNWGGTAPVDGEPLMFGYSLRQANFNDLSFTTPTLTFSNGGFVLDGNGLGIGSALNNLAGNNTISLALDWPNGGLKNWQVAAGTELSLGGASTCGTTGDVVLYGGGTLRLTGSLDFSLNPPFIVSEGKFVLDGGTYTSLGGFRIGSSSAAATPVEVVVSNSASMTLSVAAANLRVGDGAVGVPSRLIVHNGTVTMYAGNLGIPYAADCTGEVLQTGGLVMDCNVVFSDNGAGVGTYALTDGTLEPIQVRKDTAAGTAVIRFDNAWLRPSLYTTNYASFMSGLDVAEIKSGGLNIDGTMPVTIAQPLSGAGGITKVNSETVSLTGQNTYAGDTWVQQGKLVLPTIQTNGASVLVADSAELGVVCLGPNASLTAGTLSLGASTLNFDLGTQGNPAAPVVRVSSLTASGGADSVTVNVSGGLGIIAGPITLVDYSGTIGGSGFSAFNLVGLPPGVSATLVNNVANSSIDLNITVAPGLRWTGAGGSSWDYGTVSWIDDGTGASTTYSDGQHTRFLDGAATGIVNLTAAFTPSVVTVSNDTLPYVWNGGTINTPFLRKNGPGSVTRVGGEGDAIVGLELNAGSYVFSNISDVNFAAVLTDTTPETGTFVKRGAGTLTMSAGNANSTFNGTTVIQEGILKLGDTRALGATTAAITITNSGTLDVVDHQPRQPVTVSGDGTGGIGAIIDSTTATGPEQNLLDVTLAGDTTFGCPNGGRWDIRVNGSTGPAAGLKGNGYKLTKVGSGSVSIACARSTTGYWNLNLGDVLIKEGGLTFAESLTPGNPSAALAIYPGANLNLYDLNITNPLMRNITMTNAMLQCGGETSDTNVVNGDILMSGNCRFHADDARLIINGDISGSAAVAVSAVGTGTLLLNGNNTHSGNTTVTNGTIGGIGVLAGNLVMLGGTCAPGSDGVGTLTVNGNVTLAGTTRMELNGSLSPNSDRIVVGGSPNFGGALQVVLGAGAPAPQPGDVYQLFSKGGSGQFTSISLPILSGGLVWNTSKLLVNGTISVPLPATTIDSVTLSGTDFSLNGSGGNEGDTYYVVTSPNIAAPLAAWMPIATNVFGPGGSFNFTTNIVGAGSPVFFRVLDP